MPSLTFFLRSLLALFACQLATAGRASEPPPPIEASGTVIIGGEHCPMIALDDGRFIALKEGALPNTPLQARTRIRVMAWPLKGASCRHADPVRVESIQFLIDATSP